MEVQKLLGAGLLVDGERRSSLLGIPRSAGVIAAVDLGATSIEVALTTLGGEILVCRSEPADIKDGPKPILRRTKEILSEILGEQSVNGGIVSDRAASTYEGAPSVSWRGRYLNTLLSTAPIFVVLAIILFAITFVSPFFLQPPIFLAFFFEQAEYERQLEFRTWRRLRPGSRAGAST